MIICVPTPDLVSTLVTWGLVAIAGMFGAGMAGFILASYLSWKGEL